VVKITGDVRDGSEFRFSAKPDNAAPSTFAAVLPNELRVTRHAAQLFGLPATTPVLAHWHGQYRTEGFATTVGELKAKADLIYGPDALDDAVKDAKALGITVKVDRDNKHIFNKRFWLCCFELHCRSQAGCACGGRNDPRSDNESRGHQG
jgi:hypothetical protein